MTKEGMPKVVATIQKMLGDHSLCMLGFDIPMGITHKQATALNRVEEKLPSTSGIAKTNDIDLHKIMGNAAKSMEVLIVQFKMALKGQETLPM